MKQMTIAFLLFATLLCVSACHENDKGKREVSVGVRGND